MKELHVHSEQRLSSLIITVTGDAGIGNVGKLETELTRLSALRPALVVFDLSGLDFIASLGMGALMAFRRGVARNGGIVRLAAAKPVVLDAFKHAALNALFDACDTVDEALTPKAP